MRIFIDDGRQSFYQWDMDQRLRLEGVTLENLVHYGRADGGAYEQKIYRDGSNLYANVPNIWLQESGVRNVYIVQGGKETEHRVSILIKPREKPDGYIYTETEILTFISLDERLRRLEGDPDAGAYATEKWVQEGFQPKGNYLGSEDLPAAIDTALAQAKESGEFDGPPGDPGRDYVLTETDKAEIAEMAAGLVEVPDSGGNVDYVLPVGGDNLGGVKNGGNVVINADGTMTAPVSNGGSSGGGTTDINIKKWFDKKIVVDGSSITTGGTGLTQPTWSDFLKDMFALDTVYNHAASGTGWFIGSTTALQRVDDYEDDADAVIMMGDYNGIYAYTSGAGTIEDEANATGSCYAKLKYLAEKLINKYPLCPIIWVIEPPRASVGETDGTTVPMNHASTQHAYSKVIEEVAELYGFPHCNLMKNTVFRPWIQANFEATTSDGTHPWNNVQRTMAQVIAETMKRTPLFYNESYVVNPDSGGSGGESDVTLTKITATLNSNYEVYEHDNLDAIRQYLTVKAVYSDLSETVIADYTLSGELAVGISAITISYGGVETSVSVNVQSGYRAITVNQKDLIASDKDGKYISGATVGNTDVGLSAYANTGVSDKVSVMPGSTVRFFSEPDQGRGMGYPAISGVDIVFFDDAGLIVSSGNAVAGSWSFTVPDTARTFMINAANNSEYYFLSYTPGS